MTNLKKIFILIIANLMLISLLEAASTPQKKYSADVVVYGDASGGVIAAIQASKMGKKVILISQYGHLGGLSSSGLGWSDIGNDEILGGLSREFYHRLYKHYQKKKSWTFEEQDKFANKGQGGPALNDKTELAATFEPKVAEKIFNEMLAETKVEVINGRLDLKNGVIKNATKITALKLEDGTEIHGKMFIDASYEGDILPGAGVSFMIGREANSEYNETGNGITGALQGNQLPKGIDPYKIKGDASSGLLKGVNPDMGGPVGAGDHRLQAYCYRMVLTKVAKNRVMVEKPANYDESDYELVFRAIEVGFKGAFFKETMVPNLKTDSNNTGGISTDFIGGNYGADWNWATLNHQEREKLAAKHRDYQLGLIWTLQNHPRVPEKIRENHKEWGLAKDEFTDNNHWPYNIYVREARRMKSDLVMTENHCRNKIPVEDPIGKGAYTLDSHNTQRFVQNGMVRNEGDIQSSLKGKPYGISYRSIVPKATECENLLVPWALSSTHIAFGSIRMEPVFMILSQSAATAAVLAIDQNIPVQKVNYEELKKRLIEDNQKL